MTDAAPQLDSSGRPEADVEIDAELVRRLLEAQHPDLAPLELRPVASGWDNSTWRLGAELALRLPRRRAAAELIRSEQRWLPQLARRLDVPVPEPVRVGRPAAGYPWHWSIVRWTEGVSADRQPLAASEAARFGTFLAALHVPAGGEAPPNPFRGVPLRQREAAVALRLERIQQRAGDLEPELDLTAVRRAWERGLEAAAEWTPVWLHGDLHPRNVVVRSGRLAAVIDWGDLTAGDPATDLASAWMQFENDAHAAFWSAYGGASTSTHERALGWAALFGILLLDAGLAGDAAFARVGRLTLERVARSAR